jgi:hypothetical protein
MAEVTRSLGQHRALMYLIEDMQDAFADLMSRHPLPGTKEADERGYERERTPPAVLHGQDAMTRGLADKIRAGLDRLRQEM